MRRFREVLQGGGGSPWLIRRVAVSCTLLLVACGSRDVAGRGQQTNGGKSAASTTPPVATSRATTCADAPASEAADLALARCLASADEVRWQPTEPGAAPVRLYIDRSGSMRGFLDPNWPMRLATDYRSVLDRLVATLRPASGRSFGSGLRSIEPSASVLSSRTFYTDGDTRLEDAADEVARDSTLSMSHVIVGDARRGSPEAALRQFERLRDVADAWTRAGGTFLVAASAAPFTPVPDDASGCQPPADQPSGNVRCPLYLFAFVARGSAQTITTSITPSFDVVWTWPALAIPPEALTLVPMPQAGRPAAPTAVDRRWAMTERRGTPIVRSRAQSATNVHTLVRVALADSATGVLSGIQASLKGQRIRLVVRSKAFNAAAAKLPWRETSEATLVTPIDTIPRALRLLSRGGAATRTLYRIDLVPGGEPAWLSQFDAEDNADKTRTFALSRLFTAFAALAEGGTIEQRSIGHLFILAN